MSGDVPGKAHGAVSVLWVHNTEHDGAMFLWDVLDALPAPITISQVVLPLRPRLGTIAKWIRKIRSAAISADIVHAQFGSLVGLVAAFTRRPFIISLRGTDFYVLPGKGIRLRVEGILRQLFTYVACLRADIIIVMSNAMRNGVRQWPFIRNKNIIVMTDPVGNEFITQYLNNIEGNLKSRKPFKIFVGSLTRSNPVKRTWLVEHAVALCNAAGVRVELEIVSGAPRTTVKDVLCASDAIALTSTHEGWPNVVKEAQACGLPFLATDVSDLSNYCSTENFNRIVDPNELDLALAIIDLIARKHWNCTTADIFPETVGIKHQIIYLFANGAYNP